MFDKSYTIKLVNKVLKEDIIPSLDSGVAKEQAIAMVSVLKNVDLNSEQNLKPYIEVNGLLDDELTKLLASISVKFSTDVISQIENHKIELQKIKKMNDEMNKWEGLNSLLSNLLKSLYQEPKSTQSIEECRMIMRKQLDIEIQLVG
ncbi:hypothetical protein ACFOUV_09565 [Oceanobacillus longus]|uniref:Uncharacterized protein n=1 Tax=Oceanobacillus longus TaxID=930120 RepID=A0ABV8GYN2_9BACI